MLTKDGAIAANRFGLGARPGDAASIGADAKAWLLAQIERPPSSRPPDRTGLRPGAARAASRSSR